MRNFIQIFLLTFLCAPFSNAQTSLTKTIISNGVPRTFNIYIPAVYNSNTAVPLLFNFHGYTSNNTQQELYGNFKPIADTANFILVHPQGLIINGSTGFNNFGALNTAPDDILFVSNMIDSIKALYNINLNKVYSTGLSNGSFMSYDLACFLNSRIAAIASVSGSMVPIHINACNTQHATPVMHIHGTTDGVVSYTGVGGIIACMHVDSLVKYWVTKNNCNPTPVFTNIPNTNTTDLCTAEHYEYTGGDKGSTVEFYKIIGGGHTWPGASLILPNGNTNLDMNACKEIWRFLSKYSLDKLQYATPTNSNTKEYCNVFPSVTSNMLYLVNTNTISTSYIKIYDIQGATVLKHNIQNGTNTLDVTSLPKGMYYYTINNTTQQIQKGRFIKN